MFCISENRVYAALPSTANTAIKTMHLWCFVRLMTTKLQLEPMRGGKYRMLVTISFLCRLLFIVLNLYMNKRITKESHNKIIQLDALTYFR